MGGDLLDIDWLWDVTMSELAIDLETLAKDGRPFFIGVTNKNTGKAEYLLAEPETLAETMKASSALPVMYKGEVILGGESYVDGGASDSIPVAEAIKRGARKIMVLRSQTYSYRKSPPKSAAFVKYLLKSSPALIKPMLNRATQYNETIELMRTPPEGIEIIEICPPDSLNIKRLTRNPERLMQGYEIGLKAGEKAISLWSNV
jgi:predicted patatin/cPLA2 family phospholipase